MPKKPMYISGEAVNNETPDKHQTDCTTTTRTTTSPSGQTCKKVCALRAQGEYWQSGDFQPHKKVPAPRPPFGVATLQGIREHHNQRLLLRHQITRKLLAQAFCQGLGQGCPFLDTAHRPGWGYGGTRCYQARHRKRPETGHRQFAQCGSRQGTFDLISRRPGKGHEIVVMPLSQEGWGTVALGS